jgi:hypothetical protein
VLSGMLPGPLQPPAAQGADDAPQPGKWRLLDEGGALLAIAESRPGGVLHPVIVLV